LFSWLLLRGSQRALAVKTYLLVSVLFFFASGLLLGLRVILLAGTEQTYTTFSASLGSFLNNLMFYVSQAPDVVILTTACAAVGIIRSVVNRRARPAMQTQTESDIHTVMAFAYLISGVAYLFLLLLWRWPMNYYMLPVAACSSLALGHLVAGAGSEKGGVRDASVRGCIIALAIVICITRLYSMPYLHFVATAQRGFDLVEDAVSREVVKLNPVRRRVIDLERASYGEQPIQRNLLYRIVGSTDFSWVGGGDLLLQYPEAEKRLNDLSKPPTWQTCPPKTGDLFLVQASAYPFEIYLRGIGPNGLTLNLFAPKVSMLQERIRLPLAEVRRWQSEWNVYKPWTLRRRKLVFRSVIYQAEVRAAHSSSFDRRGALSDLTSGDCV
jgi:hypothetical protein